MRYFNITIGLSISALHNSPSLLKLCHETQLTDLLFTHVESIVLIEILTSIMRIYLCRVREQEDGTPYIERNREASVNDDYIAIFLQPISEDAASRSFSSHPYVAIGQQRSYQQPQIR